jgi:xanthine dehydrogenase molybdenum-binding subunit
MSTRHVGTGAIRPDAVDKAVGRAAYVHDLVRPGMLWGKIKFAGLPHARIRHVDVSRAAKLPGVRAVITGYDTPEVRIGFLRDNVALKRDTVRQQRDEVAAVAAIDPDVAAEAIELIRVEYEPLPAVFTPEDALAEGAPLVHERDPSGRPRTDNRVPVPTRHASGDLAAAERASRWIVEGTFSTPIIQQACMGTAGCIAELDASGNLSMWAKTQIPFLAQRDFIRALEQMGLPGRNARVIVPALGGGFGTGLDTHAYEYIAILLAHRTGRPVKIVYTREEEFAYLSPRQSARTHVVQGMDGSGKLTFRRLEVTQDNGAYTSWGATYPTVMLLPATSLYRVPAVTFDATIVYTNNTYCQAMRGYGNPEVAWAIESNLDELAEQAGMDPYELRARNRNVAGETTPMGLAITTCGLGECLDAAAKKVGWSEKRGAQRAKRRGVGIAGLMHVGGSGRIYRADGGGVILKLDDFGNVNVSYGGVEMGQGLHSALQLTVADALGVLPEKVFINPTDTGTCPWDVGTHASRGAFIGCNAAIRAAAKVRRKLFALAATLYPEEVRRNLAKAEKDGRPAPAFPGLSRCEPSALELRDGELFQEDAPVHPAYRIELGRMLRALHFRGTEGTLLVEEAYYEPKSELPDWAKGVGNMSATYAFGAQAVEVEVDEGTGEVTILKVVSAHDVGKVLNPQTLAGQIYGAVAQGIGFTLYEEVKTAEGRIVNPSFTDYKIPTIGEMSFPIELEFVETEDPAGPFGAKGVGEPGMVPTAPAIANAIWDAVGVRIRDLPITREKLVAALADKKQKEH